MSANGMTIRRFTAKNGTTASLNACLFAAFSAMLAFGYTGAWIALPLYVGILADVEGLAISLMLAEWRSDVPSFVHAFKFRAAAPLGT
jgi:hypothetical protein